MNIQEALVYFEEVAKHLDVPTSYDKKSGKHTFVYAGCVFELFRRHEDTTYIITAVDYSAWFYPPISLFSPESFANDIISAFWKDDKQVERAIYKVIADFNTRFYHRGQDETQEFRSLFNAVVEILREIVVQDLGEEELWGGHALANELASTITGVQVLEEDTISDILCYLRMDKLIPAMESYLRKPIKACIDESAEA